MTAKRLQSKLFGNAQANAPSRTPVQAQPSTPAEESGSGTATPVPSNVPPAVAEDSALRINIPPVPGLAPAARESLPKSTRPPTAQPPAAAGEDKTPPADPSKRSPHPGTGSDTDTPREHKSLRERLKASLGPRFNSVEEYRLDQADRYEVHWKRWGPYLAERQWGTVREDYSGNGDAWNSFNFDQAKSRAYRWGEDGIGGISDNHQRLCFSLAMWNGKDDILKERVFGLAGDQGNHGEDVKDLYYHVDSTPTHSYMKYLYKYPQSAFPYNQLREENAHRSREVSEYELVDTGIFDDGKYWDVFIEYAKDEEDANAISIRITAYNRGPEAADLHLLPQLFFRNTWSWPKELPKNMPNLRQEAEGVIAVEHDTLGSTRLYCTPSPAPAAPTNGGVVLVDGPSVVPELLFTENDTNFERLYSGQNRTPYTKDAFHSYCIPSFRPPMPEPEKKDPETKEPETKEPVKEVAKEDGAADDKENGEANGEENGEESDKENGESEEIDRSPTPKPETQYYPADKFVNPNKTGTKAAALYTFNDVPARGGCVVVRLKLTPSAPSEDPAILDEELFDNTVEDRLVDADEFYARLSRGGIPDDLRNVMRQALAGMMWTKQYYGFIQNEWLNGDPGQPPPPPERKWVRNKDWRHLYASDILSMPDSFDYPWFACWDTAFHTIPLALVDPSFAKKQLDLMTREWYMKPDGSLPAYEWNFDDVNPPVHAWATFRVFKIERKIYGREDLDFLERVFQKLLLNFTWWVNRKDSEGNNVFEGGFLGLDNIGPFNRSEPVPGGGTLRQADGTAWMAFYSLQMLTIALELAKHNPTYEDIASKFFEHFLYIADAMTYPASNDQHLSLWNEEHNFYFDAIQWGYGHAQHLPVFSMVGLIPLFAVTVLEPQTLKKFPGFKKRLDWFVANRPDITSRNIANIRERGRGDRLLLALASKDRVIKIVERMFDETQFLSDYGIRSLSKYHHDHPFSMHMDGQHYEVAYWPGDSKSAMFGGNSNWRGPVWAPVNHLLIESLQRFHQFFGDSLQVEMPTGSGYFMNLAECAEELQHRLTHIFSRDESGRRAVNGGNAMFNRDPHFRDYIHFFEFFHGNDGRGLGASHQTGWTGLVAWWIYQTGEYCRLPKTPKTPRSMARHYFDDNIVTPSEYGDADSSLYSAYTDRSEWAEPEPEEL